MGMTGIPYTRATHGKFLIYFYLFIISSFIVHEGRCQWSQVHPHLTAYNILDIDFTNDQYGWAVGEGGTVLRTTDFGETWESINLGTDIDLRGVSFPSLNHGWIIGDEYWRDPVILHTRDAGKNWESQEMPHLYFSNLSDLQFVDTMNGWIAGPTLLLTHDGGVHWTEQDQYLNHFHFLDSLNGWGISRYWEDTTEIYHTLDGGYSWTRNYEFIGAGNDIHFLNPMSGCVASDYGKILFTHNGGMDWFIKSSGGNSTGLEGIFCASKNNMYAVGGTTDWGNLVLYTFNGGLSFESQTLDHPWPLTNILFTNQDTGWCTGYMGQLYQTTDAGNSWSDKIITGVYTEIYGISALNGNMVWCAGEDGVIIHSADSGESWVRQASPTTKKLNDIFFIDSINGWACGDQGLILKTNDGGNQWNIQTEDLWHELKAIQFFNDSAGQAIVMNGTVIETSNGGNNWYPIHESLMPVHFYDMEFISRDIGYIAGTYDTNYWRDGVVLKTLDGGKNWDIILRIDDFALWKLDFLDPLRGWAVGESTQIHYTYDGGANWALINNGLTIEDIYSIAFSHKDSVYIAATKYNQGSCIYQWNRSGSLWEEKHHEPDFKLYEICFPGQYRGWGAGQGGLVLRTGSAPPSTLPPSNPKSNITQISVFPIPCSDRISFRCREINTWSSGCEISLYSMLGRKVYQKSFGGNPTEEFSVTIETENLANGTYIYLIRAKGQAISGKIIVDHF